MHESLQFDFDFLSGSLVWFFVMGRWSMPRRILHLLLLFVLLPSLFGYIWCSINSKQKENVKLCKYTFSSACDSLVGINGDCFSVLSVVFFFLLRLRVILFRLLIYRLPVFLISLFLSLLLLFFLSLLLEIDVVLQKEILTQGNVFKLT